MTIQSTEGPFLPCILQIATPNFKPLADLTFPTVDTYCLENNIPVKRIEVADPKLVPRAKINALIQVLSMGFSHCLWIDADAYINNNVPLTSFLDFQHDLFISKDINGINAGVMAVSKSAIPFLKEVLKEPFNHIWVEQMAMMKLIDNGYPVSVKYINQSSFQAYFYGLYDLTFPEGEATKDSFIIHLPGLSMEKRLELCNAKRSLYLSDCL